MSENLLYKFAKDLSGLYARTQIKDIESLFIRVAQTFESEFEKWLSTAEQTEVKSSLHKPELVDALMLLAGIRKSYPAGFSYSEFSHWVMDDPKRKYFIDIIIALRKISESQSIAILAPYKGILDSTINAQIQGGGVNEAAIADDIKKLDMAFRQHVEGTINKPYDDALNPRAKKKLTKKEKIGNLLHYLTRKFSEEIALSYEEIGELDALGLASNPDVLRDPVKIATLLFPKINYNILSMYSNRAKQLIKEISPYAYDPMYYDYIYNYLRNTIMHLGAEITAKDYNEFLYKSKLSFHTQSDEENATESDQIKISPSAWRESQSILVLSFFIYLLGSKV